MVRGSMGDYEDWDITDKVGHYQLTKDKSMKRKILQTKEERTVAWIIVGIIVGTIILSL